MNIYFHASTTLLLLVAALRPCGAEPIQILLPGQWHGDEVTAEAGPDWWGIFPEDDGFTLQSALVTITTVEDGIVDNPGEMTGKQVVVPQQAEPVLLIRGIDGLVQGPISALSPKIANVYLAPGQVIHLETRGLDRRRPLRLAALGVAKERPDVPDVQISDYELKLYYGYGAETITQSLVVLPRVDYDREPRLIWAGDIDRDGKVDLIFDLTDHYNVSHLTLFLSSAAKGGELVGKVAEWRTTGC